MGITFFDGTNKFVFDFEHDEVVSLKGFGSNLNYLDNCFYYGFDFADDVPDAIRNKFNHFIKCNVGLKTKPELTDIIQRAVDSLHKQVNLYFYELVIMPDLQNDVTRYMMRYIYRFAQPKMVYYKDVLSADAELCAQIRKQNVLIIDDVTTSGSTLGEILRTLRIINEDNKITIFSLIGRKDLMADSFV
ncbi:MAG: hypothetical protein J6T70_12375 [Bacteroidales bacterium]|nr:hypothetical protein [Bacteroidales bacterium]